MKKTIREKLKAKILELNRQRANVYYQLSRNDYQLAVLDLVIAERRVEQCNGKKIDDVYSSDLSKFFALRYRKRKLIRKQNLLDMKYLLKKLEYDIADLYGSLADEWQKR